MQRQLNSLAFIILTLTIIYGIGMYWNTIDIETLQEQIQVQKTTIDDLRMHDKPNCMTLPDNSNCTDKTMHYRQPGGSYKKAIIRICTWKSPVAQKWK